MLFLHFILEERDIHWLRWIERPLGKAGKLDQLEVVIASVLLLITATVIAPDDKVSTVMIAGVLGMITYIAVNGLGEMFHIPEEGEEGSGGPSGLAKATGKAGFFLFLYLEVLDASFSFDGGVIGAFAITSDPIIIALGLGFIGAMFVRSITIFLVRKAPCRSTCTSSTVPTGRSARSR